jgi:two-component system KDP operon response regulator KdpE
VEPIIVAIDDDTEITFMLRSVLERQGYRVEVANSGEEGLQLVSRVQPDLVVLDLMMPQMDGWEVCRRLRDISDVPVIMLTAKSMKEDVVKGLQIGADDYIIKPFSGAELHARIQAVLRRTTKGSEVAKPVGSVYSDDYLSVDLEQQAVTVRGRQVKLTPIEFKLLAHLVRNAGEVLSPQSLLTEVLGSEYAQDVGFVKLYINYLRTKIEENPAKPKYILSIGDQGYSFGQA